MTDHDSLDGVEIAQAAAQGSALEIVPGVEISAEYQGRELHLLGYFVALDHEPLRTALASLRADRLERFRQMVLRLSACGVPLPEAELHQIEQTVSLGRRHLAALLVRTGHAATYREAFIRFLHDRGKVAVPKRRLPVAEAIALVRAAGGVAAWAHPAYDGTEARLRDLHALGLQGVEAEYPGHRPSLTGELRRRAAALGLVVTGGSDCHGPGPLKRAIGACGITAAELETVRRRAAEN